MLNKLFSKPLTLVVGGQEISFATLSEFDFCLAGRTEVPAKKLSDLVVLSPHELKREAKSIKGIEKQFVDILSKSIETPGSIAEYLREIDVHVFSQDHSWREIMTALKDKDKEEEYDELRRVALVKYMQYLTSRQEVIKHTYSVKKLQAKTASMEDSDPPQSETNGSLPASAMRETVILDSNLIKPKTTREAEFTRLPKGEAIILNIEPGQIIDVLLSKHPFKLVVGEQIRFMEEDGREQDLQIGKNIIGRDAVCNVVVNSSSRDVSRLHLIVERISDNQLRLTDLSSHGTSLKAQILSDAE